MRFILLILNILLFSTIFSSNFQKGNEAYIKGNLIEAEEFYLKDLEERGESFNTLYNLGSLSINLNKEGYSKYYLTKAQQISPRDKDLNKLIKNSSIEKQLITKNETLFVNSILFLIFTLTLLAYVLLKNFTQFNFLKLIKNTSIIFFVLTIGFTVLTTLTISRRKEAIILNESMVYLSPYLESEESFNINQAEKVLIKDEYENYYYLEDKIGRYGWILKDDIGELWIQ